MSPKNFSKVLNFREVEPKKYWTDSISKTITNNLLKKIKKNVRKVVGYVG